MDPKIRELVVGYRTGRIPVDVFLKEMQALGHDTASATKFLVDQEVEASRPASAQPTPAPSQSPASPPSAPTPVPTPAPASVPRPRYPDASAAPYYGMDNMPVGTASNMPMPMQEDRLSRARLSDLPSDFGSPAGSMAYPSSLPPSLTPSTVQRAIDVAKTRQPAPQVAAQTADEPSMLATLIRGRFGEAGKGSPFDDRLTAAQEARDRMGESRATGGEVAGKSGNSRDAALHKALEIIHYMLTNR